MACGCSGSNGGTGGCGGDKASAAPVVEAVLAEQFHELPALDAGAGVVEFEPAALLNIAGPDDLLIARSEQDWPRIRVNGVRPGFIYTEMHASGGEPGRVDRVKAGLPMQRGGQPEEVAQAIAWLLSDKASYVTGSFLELAGGK